MNLGIDFGSTYSMLSYFDNDEKILKAVAPEGDSPHIPSVVCRKSKTSDTYVYGTLAKKTSDKKPELDSYRAFKMLLPVTDKKKLEQNGYRNGITPRKISRDFLQSQIQTARKRLNVNCFDQITICIPYIWDKDYSTLSGKGILYEICQGLQKEGMMRSFRVISEPAAATACVAHKYHTKKGSLFNGWILIVDYGGGTLDITLSKVSTIRRNGKDYMEISVEDQAGAGYHHADNRIGDAGIAYMNAVIAQALADEGLESPGSDSDLQIDFRNAVDLLEDTLKHDNEDLLDKAAESGNNPAVLEADRDDFMTFSYGDAEDVPVTYSTLARVYNRLIRPLLDQELKKIFNGKMRSALHMSAPTDHPADLQIALVGGFGQFILVQQQVCEFFNIGDSDDIDIGKEDAISHGAALIANGNIALQVRAPASIGICFPDETFDFAFLRGKQLEPDDRHFLNHIVFYMGSHLKADFPWKFVLNLDGNPNCGRVLIPIDEEVRNKMLQIPAPGAFKCGFSVNESEIITFWYVEADTYGNYDPAKLQKKELGNIPSIFGSVIDMEAAKLVVKK